MLDFFYAKMQTPSLYGIFHIACLLVIAGITVFLCVKFKNSTDKQHRIILFIFGIVPFIFEIYKQLVLSYTPSTGVWNYQWYAFPFQFCSTPMYIALISSFIKNKKVQEYFDAYLGTFALFAGLTVMFYPGDVFIDIVGINIQTMVCHGFMVALGIYLLVSNRCKLNFKTILKALAVFGGLLIIAMILNLLWPLLNINETFNMFFISPHYPCTLAVLQMFYPPVTPYPVFLLMYIAGFTLAATIVLSVAIGIKKLSTTIKSKKTNQQQ